MIMKRTLFVLGLLASFAPAAAQQPSQDPIVALSTEAAAAAGIPNYFEDVKACARMYPEAFACAHTERACAADFEIKCARDVVSRTGDAALGLNWKRGRVGDLSLDIFGYRGVGPSCDVPAARQPGECVPMAVIDIIGGAGGPNPQVTWAVYSRQDSPTGGWVSAFDPRIKLSTDGGSTQECPKEKPCVCQKCPTKPGYPGDRAFDAVGELLEADYREAGQRLNAQSATWFARVIYDHLYEGLPLPQSIEKHRREWRAVLGLP